MAASECNGVEMDGQGRVEGRLMASSGWWAAGSGQAQKTQAGDGWTFGGSLPPARARGWSPPPTPPPPPPPPPMPTPRVLGGHLRLLSPPYCPTALPPYRPGSPKSPQTACSGLWVRCLTIQTTKQQTIYIYIYIYIFTRYP